MAELRFKVISPKFGLHYSRINSLINSSVKWLGTEKNLLPLLGIKPQLLVRPIA
jgi:hypothetical protein